MKGPCLLIHGGAGDADPYAGPLGLVASYHAALGVCVASGWAVLAEGGSALDAVVASVVALEDEPLFNAGRGSVLNHAGAFEMDAAVMCGRSLQAGACAGVARPRNPVLLAKGILPREDLVLVSGTGGDELALELGLTLESPTYFATPDRQAQLEAARKAQITVLDHHKFGTVGAVAVDVHGDVAAATSTGGLTNKHYSRIGDSPIIGAGTLAENATCAVSCTGFGEPFLRRSTARRVADRIELLGESVGTAAEAIILREMPRFGGEGGLISVNSQGDLAMVFNSPIMYRAQATADGIYTGIRPEMEPFPS